MSDAVSLEDTPVRLDADGIPILDEVIEEAVGASTATLSATEIDLIAGEIASGVVAALAKEIEARVAHQVAEALRQRFSV